MVVTLSADKNRIKSPDLLKRIRAMHERVMDEEDLYCQWPCPQTRAPKYCDPVDAQLNNCASGLVKKNKAELRQHTGTTRRSKTVQQLSRLDAEIKNGFYH